MKIESVASLCCPSMTSRRSAAVLPRWLSRFRRLARDYERLPETLAGFHFVAFSVLMLTRLAPGLRSLNELLGSA
jgi:hypothetical protein